MVQAVVRELCAVLVCLVANVLLVPVLVCLVQMAMPLLVWGVMGGIVCAMLGGLVYGMPRLWSRG
jgi:hypothetical protein